MWILTVILVFTGGNAATMSTVTAEFKTEQQCMSHGDNVSAAFTVNGHKYSRREASFVCTFQE